MNYPGTKVLCIQGQRSHLSLTQSETVREKCGECFRGFFLQHMQCLHSYEYLRDFNLAFCFEIRNCLFMDFLENLFMLGAHIMNILF